jgi:hypothetical protein
MSGRVMAIDVVLIDGKLYEMEQGVKKVLPTQLAIRRLGGLADYWLCW